VVKESAEEITGREAKSALEGGKHHNLVCVRCRNIFLDGWTPLQHSVIREKVIHNELVNFTLIHDRWLKQVQMQGSHGWEGESLQQGINASARVEIAEK
jgi:hypothetical protein